VTCGNRPDNEVNVMIEMAILFLVVGIVAALLGFTGIAGASFAAAKIVAVIFFVLFLIAVLVGGGVLASVF
jgi:uncharacterized membrane protein YtjA (UPF0391 family)